jgi:catechol 2,3-dioxygenase-like lactoylglutathione lyase family enzyme
MTSLGDELRRTHMTTAGEPTFESIFGEMSHWGLICVDMDKTIAEYERLGYRFSRRDARLQLWRPEIGFVPEFDVRSAWSIQGKPHLELGEAMGVGGEPYLWPRRDHDHVDHVGYFVDDIATASRFLQSHGFPLEVTQAAGAPEVSGFCYHRTPSGARIELQDGPVFKKFLAERIARVLSGDDRPFD